MVLSIGIIIVASTARGGNPRTTALQEFNSNFSDLLIGTIIVFSVVLLLGIIALVLHYIRTCRSNSQDAPKFAKGYAVHMAFMSFALLASAIIAIWTIVIGHQLRALHSLWTWEVFLISFFGIIVAVLCILFNCTLETRYIFK